LLAMILLFAARFCLPIFSADITLMPPLRALPLLRYCR